MKINIYPLVSKLHEKNRIDLETNILLNELKKCSKHEFNIVSIDELYNADLSLLLIQSGGSEGLFLENFCNLKSPYYLLTYGHNNSLAASIEILSYIKYNRLNGEILHGDTDYILNRINELTNQKEKAIQYRFGVIGKPSDWLIASNVDYQKALAYHNIELIDINIEEVVNEYSKANDDILGDFTFDKLELKKAFKLHNTLIGIKDKYNLNGLTIRCFSLLDKINTTACLSLALLNKDGIIGTCEGDIPTMISMHILNKITGMAGFQANPSRINIKENKMVLAHCTMPLNMCDSYKLDTHFESGIGVAVKGELKRQKITIFKLCRDLKNYFVTTGTIINNLNESNLCRTQIEIIIDKYIEYFLTNPYGNHHVIVYGDYEKEINDYFNKY